MAITYETVGREGLPDGLRVSERRTSVLEMVTEVRVRVCGELVQIYVGAAVGEGGGGYTIDLRTAEARAIAALLEEAATAVEIRGSVAR